MNKKKSLEFYKVKSLFFHKMHEFGPVPTMCPVPFEGLPQEMKNMYRYVEFNLRNYTLECDKSRCCKECGSLLRYTDYIRKESEILPVLELANKVLNKRLRAIGPAGVKALRRTIRLAKADVEKLNDRGK